MPNDCPVAHSPASQLGESRNTDGIFGASLRSSEDTEDQADHLGGVAFGARREFADSGQAQAYLPELLAQLNQCSLPCRQVKLRRIM